VSWALVLVLAVAVVRLRRRLELVARAEHELRGPLTAVALAAESARRGREVDLESELERARVALADLTAARRGRRARTRGRMDLERVVRSSAESWGARVDWRAGAATADGARVAQALGNLLANAAEHGNGPASVLAERRDSRVYLQVANERGRGLKIARDAARDAGGHLWLATLDLPAAE
jgi:signal transduction histidine kinase